MMRAKAGEVDALKNLSAAARSRTMPLIHLCENVSTQFASQLGATWAGLLSGLDGSFNFQRSGSATTFTAVLSAMRNAGIPTMPCFGANDAPPYQQTARSLVDDNGVVIKASPANLATLANFLASFALAPADVDLVVDVRHIAGIDVPSYAGYLTNTFVQNAALLSSMQSVTLASGAAPKDHSSLAYGSNHIPRTDWMLWSAVRNTVSFQLDYGDYLTGHPDLTDPPGVAMAKATVSARYTLDSDWLIIKGRSTNGPNGQSMTVQYAAHAGLITGNAGFGGVGAWADGQIAQAAAGAPKMGSRQKWAGFSANRHLELVANRLP